MNQALPQREHHPAGGSDTGERIGGLVERARRAMAEFHPSDQARVDEAVTALAWSLYKPEHAEALAALAVEDTGLGNAADKVIKNQRKTFGTLRDLMRVRSVGVIEEDVERGIVKYAKPVGVVAALTPSTNPAATPVNKSMMAVKGRNAVIVAPSPAGLATTTTTVSYMRRELGRIGAPADLVQVLPSPVDRAATSALMEACDLVVVTGSQNNVRGAYRSGTPAVGVGAGNVPVIIDAAPISTTRRPRSPPPRPSTTRPRAPRRTLSSFSTRSMTTRSPPCGARADTSRGRKKRKPLRGPCG